MEKQIMGYKSEEGTEYGVLIYWGTGPELKDLVKVKNHIKFDDMDEMIWLYVTLGKMIEDWGDTECTNA